MPDPSFDPNPLPSAELRLVEPEEAHEASYLAASLRTASLCVIDVLFMPRHICSFFVPFNSFVLFSWI